MPRRTGGGYARTCHAPWPHARRTLRCTCAHSKEAVRRPPCRRCKIGATLSQQKVYCEPGSGSRQASQRPRPPCDRSPGVLHRVPKLSHKIRCDDSGHPAQGRVRPQRRPLSSAGRCRTSVLSRYLPATSHAGPWCALVCRKQGELRSLQCDACMALSRIQTSNNHLIATAAMQHATHKTAHTTSSLGTSYYASADHALTLRAPASPGRNPWSNQLPRRQAFRRPPLLKRPNKQNRMTR